MPHDGIIQPQDNTKPLTKKEYEHLLKGLSGWRILNGKQLRKEWILQNFSEVIVFINKIAGLTEEEGHHPDICLHDYRYAQITLSTHTVGGLTRKDFNLATKIDEININEK